MMMKHRLSYFLIPLMLLVAAPVFGGQGATEPLSCADKSIVARAVRTAEDIQTFVQCAYEHVQDVGFVEARRAFNEDVRWKSGSIYIFVSGAVPMSDQAQLFVFPPARPREGSSLGLLIDAFGNDYYKEQHRIVSGFGEGWIYYSFPNQVTGRDEPKASYIKSIDWEGNPAAIGAGVHRRDIPGTCEVEEVPRQGARGESFQREASGVCPLRRDGDGIAGVLRRPGPVERSPLAERFDLPVRIGQLRQHAVQRRSLPPVVWHHWSRVERPSGRTLRRPGCGERRRCVRGNLPVLLDAQPRHRDAAAEGDFRQEGRGLWPAHPRRCRILSGRVRPQKSLHSQSALPVSESFWRTLIASCFNFSARHRRSQWLTWNDLQENQGSETNDGVVEKRRPPVSRSRAVITAQSLESQLYKQRARMALGGGRGRVGQGEF